MVLEGRGVKRVKAEMENEISKLLREHKWCETSDNPFDKAYWHDLFGVKKGEYSKEDLIFENEIKPNERAFGNIRVWISDDTKLIVAYLEMGW